jgi:hypothetical protein
VQPLAKQKLNTESADTKKTASKQDTTQTFKVQISSGRKMDLQPRNFKGLRNISMDYENSAYKYMYGETLIMMSLRTFGRSKQRVQICLLLFFKKWKQD